MKLRTPFQHALFRLLICAAGPLDGGGGGQKKKKVVGNPYDKNKNNNAAAAAAATASNNDGDDDNNNNTINNNNGGQSDAPRSAALQSNVSRALSTLGGDNAAIDLLNYYLVHVLNVDDINTIDLSLIGDDMESFLTGYSYYLRNTNIPHNHKMYIERPDLEPTKYLMHTSLSGYLSKAILLLKELFPFDEFLGDDKAMENISGAQFEKACKRAQSKKDYSFGQESKIGLYRRARYGVVDPYIPHWSHLVNCDEICKQMLLKTKINNITERMTEKRLQLVLTYHGVARSGEAQYVDWKQSWYNPYFDSLDALWQEMKTLNKYVLSFVPNKDGYLTDVFHALGTFFVVGKGLYRTPNDKGKLSTKIIPYLSEGMKEGGVARFLTRALRNNLHPDVPKEQEATLSGVSLRIAGVTEMAAGNVGVSSSHARSGHKLFDTNQKHYTDEMDPFTGMPAAKCLAGWTNYFGDVSLPQLSCLGVSEEVINKLIGHLVPISLPDFLPNGRLRPILLASIASLLMYDEDVIRDLKTADNAVSLALRRAFKETKIGDRDPVATLKLWGQLIRKDFHDRNPDFQSLTDSSNSTQVVNSINHIGRVVSNLQQENRELKALVTSMAASMEGERTESRNERRENASLRQEVAVLSKQVGKLLLMYNPQFLPSSPQRTLDVTASPRAESSRKRPPPPVESEATTASKRTTPTNDNEEATTLVDTENSSMAASLPPTAASSTTNTTLTLERNYNGVDADQQQGGTSLRSIIVEAYRDGCFQPDVSFTPGRMKRPARFRDNAKYEYCLKLFNAVVTEDHIASLNNPELELTDVENVAAAISKACLERLQELDPKKSNKVTDGYSGVGLRVQKKIGEYPNLKLRLDAGQQRLNFGGSKAN